MQICEYGCGLEAKHYFPTVKKWCCSPYSKQCLAKRKENSIRMKETWKNLEVIKAFDNRKKAGKSSIFIEEIQEIGELII